jgi:hypothetical protein
MTTVSLFVRPRSSPRGTFLLIIFLHDKRSGENGLLLCAYFSTRRLENQSWRNVWRAHEEQTATRFEQFRWFQRLLTFKRSRFLNLEQNQANQVRWKRNIKTNFERMRLEEFGICLPIFRRSVFDFSSVARWKVACVVLFYSSNLKLPSSLN